MTDPAQSIWRALEQVLDPEIRKPLTQLDMIRHVYVDDSGHASITLALTIIGCPAADVIHAEVSAATLSVEGITSVTVNREVMTPDERRALTDKLRGGKEARAIPFNAQSLTRIYAVTSGKGGVGKSSVTANLGVSLAKLGLRVGIVDVDIHGFSIPGLLGLTDAEGLAERPTRIDEMILPPVAYGVKVISIGMFVESNRTAVAWRGPMLHRTIEQFLRDVFFGDLDILLLDLPPGTGDVAISLGQLLPHAEVLVVTTPQNAAADVAERSGVLATSTGQRVVGVIENMAGFTGPDGTVIDIFGTGGGAEVARRLTSRSDTPIPLLASIPLSMAVRIGGDDGVPVVISHPDDPASAVFETLARTLSHRRRGLQGKKLDITVR